MFLYIYLKLYIFLFSIGSANSGSPMVACSLGLLSSDLNATIDAVNLEMAASQTWAKLGTSQVSVKYPFPFSKELKLVEEKKTCVFLLYINRKYNRNISGNNF